MIVTKNRFLASISEMQIFIVENGTNLIPYFARIEWLPDLK